MRLNSKSYCQCFVFSHSEIFRFQFPISSTFRLRIVKCWVFKRHFIIIYNQWRIEYQYQTSKEEKLIKQWRRELKQDSKELILACNLWKEKSAKNQWIYFSIYISDSSRHTNASINTLIYLLKEDSMLSLYCIIRMYSILIFKTFCNHMWTVWYNLIAVTKCIFKW